MKVLIADKVHIVGVEGLKGLGLEVEFEPGLSAEDLENHALAEIDPDILIVRSTKVRAPALAKAKKLSLIIRAGAGVDTIDVAAASQRGIFVANCPGKNSVAVAELTWGLILACDRRIPQQTAELRQQQWSKSEYQQAFGLYGRCLGLVGYGAIAREVAQRAKAFGMEVCVWSRSMTRERAEAEGLKFAAEPLELAKLSDVVSVHVASTPETQDLINESFVAAMRHGATLINTSRGAVVDETALLKGLESKDLRAGLDVYDNEPSSSSGDFTTVFREHPNFVGTHHIGASTDQAQQATAMEAVTIVERYVNASQVPNCVNRSDCGTASCRLTVRHRNCPGVLAKIFAVLGAHSLNVETMENLLYSGEQAACARIDLGQTPDPQTLKELEDCSPDIYGLEVNIFQG